MKSGRLNIMLFIAVTPSRSHYMDFVQIWPIPYTIPFYVRRGEEDRLKNYEDFYQLNVGVVNGYSYFEKFDNDERINKTVVLREDQLPKMLSAGRIDAYIGFNIGHEKLEQEFPKITTAPYTHKFSETALLAISQASPLSNHLPKLKMVIHNMIDDGSLDKIWYDNLQGYTPPYYYESNNGVEPDKAPGKDARSHGP
ncbi:substrate-binding periplasmic protein [Pseudomaricurvus sp.]|uniref:substrate-binding periplasmic protein n=1 Tax=Pseudomaricurvus sp. TaxID=2004510 RepID=UPI003F6B5BF0